MLKGYWGDAQVWMCIAKMLYRRNNIETFDEGIQYPNTNELNVASVCAGYAFELIYKVLVMVGGQQPKGTHRPSVAHADLYEQDRIEVERIITNHGWMNIEYFLSHLNDELCHTDRKYWMKSLRPTSGPASGTFTFGGLKGFDKSKSCTLNFQPLP